MLFVAKKILELALDASSLHIVVVTARRRTGLNTKQCAKHAATPHDLESTTCQCITLIIDACRCTVRVISPVQSEHTCSEMRYCNHRDQCAWRCFTARQDNKHTLVGLSRPPRKAKVAPGKCRSTEQFSQTISAVKTGVQVESMLVRKGLRHRYPALTMVCAKTGQLSTVVSSFDSKAMA